MSRSPRHHSPRHLSAAHYADVVTCLERGSRTTASQIPLAEKERRWGSRRTVESYARMLRDFFGRVFIAQAAAWLAEADALLLGRRTYEAFAQAWPQAPSPRTRSPSGWTDSPSTSPRAR